MDAPDLASKREEEPEPAEVDGDDDDHDEGINGVIGLDEAVAVEELSDESDERRREESEGTHSMHKSSLSLNGLSNGMTTASTSLGVSFGFETMRSRTRARSLRPKSHARCHDRPEKVSRICKARMKVSTLSGSRVAERGTHNDGHENDDQASDVERVGDDWADEVPLRRLLRRQDGRLEVAPRRDPGVQDQRNPTSEAEKSQQELVERGRGEREEDEPDEVAPVERLLLVPMDEVDLLHVVEVAERDGAADEGEDGEQGVLAVRERDERQPRATEGTSGTTEGTTHLPTM